MNSIKVSGAGHHVTIYDQENRPDAVIHLVKSGYIGTDGKPLFYIFTEDAYESEPFESGIETISLDKIAEKYGQTVANEVENFNNQYSATLEKAKKFDIITAFVKQDLAEYNEILDNLVKKYGETPTKDQASHLIEITGKIDVLEAVLKKAK